MKISFTPLVESDFLKIEEWLKNVHVKETWGNESWDESYEKYLFRTHSDVIKQFIIRIEDKPIGYIQYYWASKIGNGWWENVDDTTVGFDLYIGETNFIGKGFGEKVVKEFVSFLFSISNVNRVIADPNPSNTKIIYLLEKIGFQSKGVMTTPDGDALLLEIFRN